MKMLYYKAMCTPGSLQEHDSLATMQAIKRLAELQAMPSECEVKRLSLASAKLALAWCDAIVLPYIDSTASHETRQQFEQIAKQAAELGKRTINLLTDVDPRFANQRASQHEPLLSSYDEVWYTQRSEAVAKRTFAQAASDWAGAEWSHFPQTQLGFAEQLQGLEQPSTPGKSSWLYDCMYYGLHKQSRVERLRRYFADERFASACYGSQICGATGKHIDTELRVAVADVLTTLLPRAKFSLYVTCLGHYSSACFRLVEAALAGRACLIDAESAEAGSFGLDSRFFVQSSADIASMCAKPNDELCDLYKQYLQGLLSWTKALPSNTAKLAACNRL